MIPAPSKREMFIHNVPVTFTSIVLGAFGENQMAHGPQSLSEQHSVSYIFFLNSPLKKTMGRRRGTKIEKKESSPLLYSSIKMFAY